MSTLKLEVVTVERIVYSDDVDMVVAPGSEGQLGILPHHAPLMTALNPGALTIRKGDEDTLLAISGGYLEVRPDKVTVLADAAERADEIDIARAEAARKRAEERMKSGVAGVDTVLAEAALRRSMVRLQVAGTVRRRKNAGNGRPK